MKSSNQNRGFTLIEVMISIAIFALLGIACNTVLDTVLKNDEITEKFDTQLRMYAQAMAILDQDMTQWVARKSRAFPEPKGRVFYHNNGSSSMNSAEGVSGQQLTFFRLGWPNPNAMLPRGQVQQVKYQVRDHKLERLSTTYPEMMNSDAFDRVVLFEQVESIEFRFYASGKWRQRAASKRLPRAVEMKIIFDDESIIRRRYLIASDTE